MRVGAPFRSRRVLVIALLGFSSGLPYFLTGQTLIAWLTDEHVRLETIGLLPLVGTPYSLKWAWAPLLDRYRLPFLGRRRGWLLALQLALIAAIGLMGTLDPGSYPFALAAAALLVSFLSASQDIVVDAFVADSVRPDERAAGGAMAMTSYRAAMLVSGGAALALADQVMWQAIYWSVAGTMVIGIAGTLLAREPDDAGARPTSLLDAVVRPVMMILQQPSAAVMLVFVALYKFGDQVAFPMVIPFLVREVELSFAEIATMYYLVGLAGVVVGGALAGDLVARFGLRRCLFAFGALQALTNLGWALVPATNGSLAVLAVVVVADNLANAMGAAAFVGYLISRCHPSVSATQYALLTSLSSLAGRTVGIAGAAIVLAAGWQVLWIATVLVAVPALALVPFIPVDEHDRPR